MTPTPAPRFGRTSPTADQRGRTYLVTTGLCPVIIATVHVDAGDVADELVRLANTAPDLLAMTKPHLRLAHYDEDLRAALDYVRDGHTSAAAGILRRMLQDI